MHHPAAAAAVQVQLAYVAALLAFGELRHANTRHVIDIRSHMLLLLLLQVHGFSS
jgi:hypothetical protein